MIKVKKFFQNAKFKALMVMSMLLCSSSLVFASDPAAPSDISAQIDAVTTTITGAFDVTLIAKVIGAILGSGLGFWILWWAVRKITRGVKNAFAGKDISV